MDEFTSNNATVALNLLANTSVDRNELLAQFNDNKDQDSDDEVFDTCAQFCDHSFNEGGSTAIKALTNLETDQFEMMWCHVHESV